ncbi:hypothetical protein Mgra_00008669 [Meloidogyne graminicola]|uniref:Uncharacterized protein n=1 Tax=Meloidogyne graminicola TaxID=189291 RepID=A0A8S9ZF06_9BILA|nr:hypothetical protein Mgra_00008669 [Meloidogyne graminicola]
MVIQMIIGDGEEKMMIFLKVGITNMSFIRPQGDIPRFRSFGHKIDEGNKPHSCRFKLLKFTKEKYLTDGFSNLNYRVESINYGKLYTHIMADVFEEEYNKWKNYIKTIGC